MNILLINHYAGSLDMGMEYRPYYLAREWVKAGCKVDIFAASFSHLRSHNPQVSQDFQTQTVDGITYHWIKTGHYRKNGIRRALTMLEFTEKLRHHAKQIAKQIQPDAIICSSTYPLDTYAGQKIRKYAEQYSGHKVCLVYEIHDVWPATLTEIGGFSKNNPFVRILQRAEDSAYRHSDKIVSLLPYAMEHCAEHGMAKDKYVFVPNGIYEENWVHPTPLPAAHEQVFDELRRKGKFIVGYFGSHSLANALDDLLDTAAITTDPDIVYVLVGTGPEKPRLMERASREHLENVVFLDPVPKKSVPALCQKLDCAYICVKNSSLYRFGISLNKIFDSMRGGLPMILEMQDPPAYITQYNCSVQVDSGDAAGAVAAIGKLKSMPLSERVALGQNGVSAAKEHFNYTKLSQMFLAAITCETKNILLINHYAGSPDMGMEFRPFYLSREWARMGYHAYIIAADYSHLRIKNPSVSADFQEETIEGITYIWVRAGQYQGNGVRRALSMFRFVHKIKKKARWIAEKYRPDVVIESSTYPLDTYAGQKIKKYSRATTIHEVHDMWPLTLTTLGRMKRWNPFVVLMQIAENSFCRHSDYVVSLLCAAKDYFVRHGMKEEKFYNIMNGVVREEWERPSDLPDDAASLIETLRAQRKFILCFFGSITESYAIDYMIRAMKMRTDEKAVFLIVGDGSYKESLMKMAGEQLGRTIFFIPKIPKTSVPALLQHIDATYIGALNNEMFQYGICMNKLFDAMMCGKPILYAVNAPNNFITDYHCGISVEAEDAVALYHGLEKLMSASPEEREKMGANGHEAVMQFYTYDQLARQFAQLFH